MNGTSRVELLAPAGNIEAFYGAIHAGADAIYLGGNKFGARAYADNFSEEELVHCIRYAHILGRRVYLTVNTLVKEEEIDELYGYLLPFYEAGLDGVIVQDLGVFSYIKDHFPHMELHASTQMTLTGPYGAAMLKEMGACRIVPARELSLAEIREIKEETGIEVETFIHGAMCYCYSGQCLFSSILGGRSGNRGRCAQPCRLPYQVSVDKQHSRECYPLSLKDMCTIEMLPQLIETGIDSFKIEGRMKKAEYAAGVTAIYRKYIDLYYELKEKGCPDKFRVSSEDLEALARLYIRKERQTGYYDRHNGKEMVTLTEAAYSGSDDALLSQIRRRYLSDKVRLPISVFSEFKVGENARLTLIQGEHSVTVEGNPVEPASKQPISRENIETQLQKLGDSIFYCNHIETILDDMAFYPLKSINELRRKAVTALEDAMIAAWGYPGARKVTADEALQEEPSVKVNPVTSNPGTIRVLVHTMEQFQAFIHWWQEECNTKQAICQTLYVDADLYLTSRNEIMDTVVAMNAESTDECTAFPDILLALPYIIRKRDRKDLQTLLEYTTADALIQGFLVRNIEGLSFLKHHKYQGHIVTDYGFYVWNRRTVRFWHEFTKGMITGFCLPLELRSKEQWQILKTQAPFEKLIYGRIPMMITANCVAKSTASCEPGAIRTVSVTDRYKKVFPVMLNCRHCMNIIYNSLPLSLHGEWSKWSRDVGMRLDFTTESAYETQEILEYFAKLYKGNASLKPPYADYTTGHEKRGVE